MQIERRERLIAAHYRDDAVDCVEQRHQAVGQFEYDFCAKACDHRHVAQELDGVAEALLGVQQNCFAVQIFAAPLRLSEFA